MSSFFNTLQVIAGLLAILGLVVWTSIKHENKKWRPFHQKLTGYIFDRVKNNNKIYVLEEFKSLVWSGKKTENGVALKGFVPIGIYLDTSFKDLQEFETLLLSAGEHLNNTEHIELEVSEIIVREVKTEFLHPDRPEAIDEELLNEPSEGELRIDVAEKMLKKFISAHLINMLEVDNLVPSEIEKDPTVFSRRIRMNIKTSQTVLIRLEIENDVEIAEQLENRISYTFGSLWEVAFYN